MIQQYDGLIQQSKEVFNTFSSINKVSVPSWPAADEEEIILQSDAAFELGGNGAYALSGIFFTTSGTIGTESNDRTAGTESGVYVSDGVFNSPEAFGMESSIDYAKFVFLRLKPSAVENKDSQQLYGLFRKLEYVRYHALLKGFSIRISSAQHREVSRISKEAVKEGINLASIAQAFVEAYLKIPEVESVQLYVAAHPENQQNSGAFTQLQSLSRRAEEITDSLNVIFKGLKMDCSTCGQKQLCDEIEGIKDLHKSMLQ